MFLAEPPALPKRQHRRAAQRVEQAINKRAAFVGVRPIIGLAVAIEVERGGDCGLDAEGSGDTGDFVYLLRSMKKNL